MYLMPHIHLCVVRLKIIYSRRAYVEGDFMVNKGFLHGRLTADPELRTVKNNKNLVSSTLAVQGVGKDAKTDFIPIVAWDNTAELIAKHCKKGSELVVEYHLYPHYSKDKKDNTHFSLDVVVDSFDFCGSKGSAKASDSSADDAADEEGQNVVDDELEPYN